MIECKECAKDEFCVGNTHRGDAKIAWLKERGIDGCRLGNQAYDIEGNPLPPDIYRPLIINNINATKYDKVMMKETFRRDAAKASR